jgi:hypothetical protein
MKTQQYLILFWSQLVNEFKIGNVSSEGKTKELNKEQYPLRILGKH